MASVLFITRTWHGTGGLQRMSHDLWDGWKKRYGEDAQLCAPRTNGFLAKALFVVRALIMGMHAARYGVQIHLGDASLSFIAWTIKRFRPARISSNACGLDLVYPARWYQWLLRRTVSSVDVFACNSVATQNILKAKGWQGESVVIPCGITPVAPRTAQPTAYQLLTVGRLIPRKGVQWFVDAVMPLLLRDDPSIHLTIIGTGNEKIAASSRVSLVGAVSDQEKDRLLRGASLLVMPNVHRDGDLEGFGIVCLEASVRGVPVAAACVDGIPDAVIEGVTGQLFVGGNPQDAAAVITQMLRKSWDAQAISDATLKRYAWPHILDLYEEHVLR